MGDIEQDIELNLSQYVEVILRRRWIVALISLLVLGSAVGYAFYSSPVFRATTVLNIERENSNPVPTQSQQSSTEGQDEAYFDTQAKLIVSDTALRHVYKELNLAASRDFHAGVRALKDSVSASPVAHTRLCNINADSTEPQLAMKISTLLAQYFVEQNLNNQLFMSKDVLDSLQARGKGDDPTKINESLPQVVNNQLVQSIKAQIFAGEAQLADLRMKYTDNHPAIQSLKSRLESMKKVLSREVANIVQSLKTELSGQLRANNVRIVDLPQLPDKPVRPRKALAMAFGLLGGLALGIFVALLIETLDQTVRTQDCMERRVGLPFLGLIPFSKHKKGASIYAPLITADVSLTSEAFRNVRTMIGFAESAIDEPILLVTSTLQEEGKSYVASNIAVALSQLGQKVLLVDGDLRRPRVHTNLRASSERGICDFLSGAENHVETLVQKSEIPHLDVITCGPRPPNPAELLNTKRLAEFVAWARSRYTRVIIDCPPVFPISDILLWGRHVKPAVFVARFGRTRVPIIKTACARLRGGGINILGGVINGARLGTMTYADGRYYEAYYRDYVDTGTAKTRRA
jgi:capsular exopolysaccharide synthesis family protein